MPLDQWLYFDALDCLPEDEEPFPNPEDYAPVRTWGRGASLIQTQDWGRKRKNGPEILTWKTGCRREMQHRPVAITDPCLCPLERLPL